MKGVAVVCRRGPWFAGTPVFAANGFASMAAAQPDYELLIKKFDQSSADPAFRGDWDRKIGRYGRGLTLITAPKCRTR